MGNTMGKAMRSIIASAAALTAAAALWSAPTASAAPTSKHPAPQAEPAPHAETAPNAEAETVEPSVPMPVRSGALGYLATRSATLWLDARGADSVIANLPVPGQYRAANKQMAASLARELDAAVATPGACLQIIVDTADGAGGLFNYGFFAVERQYCPE
ncbi:MAG: hypothetical protein WBA05_03150 [Gordonia sp. (in: high G+C Gram-positive bacteria)]|uniref:hypothetical protein n=1 Tax=Gordonia sp. (in: high G+C Gram-positive bacteria) TaxID=84139 RepID=UPI003C70E035